MFGSSQCGHLKRGTAIRYSVGFDVRKPMSSDAESRGGRT